MRREELRIYRVNGGILFPCRGAMSEISGQRLRAGQRPRACIFAASRIGRNSEHADAARDVGQLLSRLGWEAVYGGGPAGLMGAFAQGYLAGGARLTGVVPEDLYMKERHQAFAGVEIVTTPTIYERKRRMIEGIELFIALPGGIGTLDELFEVVEMKYHGEISARIALYSPDGFWNQIDALMEKFSLEGYVTPIHREIMERPSSIAAVEEILLEAMSARSVA